MNGGVENYLFDQPNPDTTVFATGHAL